MRGGRRSPNAVEDSDAFIPLQRMNSARATLSCSAHKATLGKNTTRKPHDKFRAEATAHENDKRASIRETRQRLRDSLDNLLKSLDSMLNGWLWRPIPPQSKFKGYIFRVSLAKNETSSWQKRRSREGKYKRMKGPSPA